MLIAAIVIRLTPHTFAASSYRVSINDQGMKPSTLSVKVNRKVHIDIVNRGLRVHNFVIPRFYIFTQNLQPGQSTSAEFTPDRTGRFRYYSDTGGRPETGLAGIMRVAP
ncbi:MAG: cupredoxin domain-containing protein [Firmicutes bacterium]|nr:cupredoxin domain-containing protein [Bacillota bacterium]